ncbi:MAG TPA: Ig-like domain-containing protein, partial [Thermomicrobiales bacterium]|nr:Ig-like domain-containing protein [Thermomicrobiales bacterium]
AGTGSSNAGALYSFGASSGPVVSDRALGSVGSGGTGTIYWAVRLTNHTNATITSLDVSYAGEQWRMGGSSGSPAPPSTAQTVDFQYQVGNPGVVSAANSPSTGWSDFDPLDFTSPVFGPTAAAALDGNAAANRVALAATLTVTILPGQEIWLRWQDIDHPNNDHGLAIDDFSVTPHGSAAADTPPGVSATFPVNDATDVSIASDVVITFTEPVTAASGAFSFACDSAAQAFQAGVSADHTTFTLDPDAALPAGAHCIVSVTASRITDADGVPPDQMAADYAFSFSTPAPDVPPVVAATTPADNASAVSLTTHLVVTFSEVVAASPTAFNVECPAGSPIGVTASASPASSYTLTPNGALPAATACTVTVSANQIADVDLPADAMPSNYSFSFATANAPPPGVGNVIINEVDADTPGTDSAEFVELYDGGAGNTPLDGLVLVFYNGNGDVSYAAFDLAGRHTNANGYFTIGNPGVANVDMVFDPGAAGLLQNGADAVALYVDDISHFPTGTPVTTANLQDAFVYGTDDPDDAGLLALLNADQPQVNENGGGDGQNQSSQRCPNGSGGALTTSTYAQAAPTPGVANVCTPAP